MVNYRLGKPRGCNFVTEMRENAIGHSTNESLLSKCIIQKFKVMSVRNRVTLIGRTGKEVEIVNFENGMLAKVSLATSDYYTNAKGDKVEETQWHNLVAYGKTAEIMQKYVQKGKEIAVEGKLTYRNYEDKDGQKRYITEIRVEEILLLDK